jgi:hypothetical protein
MDEESCIYNRWNDKLNNYEIVSRERNKWPHFLVRTRHKDKNPASYGRVCSFEWVCLEKQSRRNDVAAEMVCLNGDEAVVPMLECDLFNGAVVMDIQRDDVIERNTFRQIHIKGVPANRNVTVELRRVRVEIRDSHTCSWRNDGDFHIVWQHGAGDFQRDDTGQSDITNAIGTAQTTCGYRIATDIVERIGFRGITR